MRRGGIVKKTPKKEMDNPSFLYVTCWVFWATFFTHLFHRITTFLTVTFLVHGSCHQPLMLPPGPNPPSLHSPGVKPTICLPSSQSPGSSIQLGGASSPLGHTQQLSEVAALLLPPPPLSPGESGKEDCDPMLPANQVFY